MRRLSRLRRGRLGQARPAALGCDRPGHRLGRGLRLFRGADREGSVWDYQTLDALAEPRNWAPGTKMAFAGLKKPEERADVILYLRSLSNQPAPLP